MTMTLISNSHPITTFARPQVKGILRVDDRIYLAAETGLYEVAGHALSVIGAWQGQPVQCIAQAPDGFLLLIESEQGQTLHQCDDTWRSVEQIPSIPGEKIKALCGTQAGFLAGTKTGVFCFTERGWQRLFADAHGRGEVLWISSCDGLNIIASVKKMGAGARPALIESHDGGQSWAVTASHDYQDIVLAANDLWIVTRWRGARRRGEHGEIKKHPLSAANLLEDGWSVLDGDKLEAHRAGHGAASFYHPIIAEAERLLWLSERVLVAGVQGAYLVDIAQGSVTDLFANTELRTGLGKIKRIFPLDDGALLVTATFGTFRSTDAGITWSAVDAEWTVLDAEHLFRGADGRWWLACQRALFASNDNGLSWYYVKLKVKQQHYCELRGGIAIVGDRLYVGTKAGLLESAITHPEAVSYVPGFDQQPIEALHADRLAGDLIVGTGDGALWRYAVHNREAKRLADVPVDESSLAGRAGCCVLVTGEQVFEVGAGTARDITPAGPRSTFGLAPFGEDGFLLWNHDHAWRGTVGGVLAPLPDWPQGVRHASVAQSGRLAHTTDRRTLCHLALTAE